MKNFTEYLTESKKQYDFKVKIAGEVTNEQEDHMKRALGRYTVADTLQNFKRTQTPIQALPLDFPQIRNCEVNIYEVTLDYPTTQQELTEYLSTELGISKQKLVVYNSKVNYDGCLSLPAGVWLIHTSLTIERNSSIWITPLSQPFSLFIAAYDNPAIGGNMIHSSSETFYYLYPDFDYLLYESINKDLIGYSKFKRQK
jgi:hypothetical protein